MLLCGIVWNVSCKLIFFKFRIVAAYTCAFPVCNYQVRNLEHQIVVEHLLQCCIAQFYIWGLALHYYLRIEIVVKCNKSNLLQMVSGSDFGQIFITDSNKVRMSGIVDALTQDRAYFETVSGTFRRI